MNFYSSKKNIVVTGGSGFIGSALIRKLLDFNNLKIFNFDKLGYASDPNRIKKSQCLENYKFVEVDLCNLNLTKEAISHAKPDLVFHLAAETHVDRSIDMPISFFENNILGTFNLLESSLELWKSLTINAKEKFRLIHVSTDEVFGSIKGEKKFNENSPYFPNSPYSASKASSDHFVRAWNKTYNLPTIITNCSNNYGPWQFPEKFIPNTILKANSKIKIPIYGNGKNIRDWLFVDDHIDALMLIAEKGIIGKSYCIGGKCEKTNIEVVEMICEIFEKLKNDNYNYKNLISFVTDRPGHDFRYAIDISKIKNELNWSPKRDLKDYLEKTIIWYLENLNWCDMIYAKSNYDGGRLGLNKSIT